MPFYSRMYYLLISAARYVMFLLPIFFIPAIAYLYIFGSGLMAGSLIRNFIEGGKFPSKFSNYLKQNFRFLRVKVDINFLI